MATSVTAEISDRYINDDHIGEDHTSSDGHISDGWQQMATSVMAGRI